MPKQYSRSRRVAVLVQRELAVIIQKFTHDKINGMVTISHVDISPDLQNANVFITCLGDEHDAVKAMDLLNQFSTQFRHDLASAITLRVTPKLLFKFDSTLERANKLTELIDSINVNKNR